MLERRVPPAGLAPAADVVQTGAHQGQFGDQTTPDAPGAREGRGAEDGVANAARRSGTVQAGRPVMVQHPVATHFNAAIGRQHGGVPSHGGGLHHR